MRAFYITPEKLEVDRRLALAHIYCFWNEYGTKGVIGWNVVAFDTINEHRPRSGGNNDEMACEAFWVKKAPRLTDKIGGNGTHNKTRKFLFSPSSGVINN